MNVSRWEWPALLVALTLIVSIAVMAVKGDAISDPLPPCDGEAHIAGTCRGENPWGIDS